MKTRISILWLLMIMILSVSIVYRKGYRRGVASVETGTLRDTLWKRYDSVIFIPAPVPIWCEPISRPAAVDTAGILSEHYSRKIYTDSIRVDSFLYVSITDTLERNSLAGRKIGYTLNIPTVTLRTKQPHLSVSVIGDSRYYAGAQIGWKRVLFSAGYDFKERSPVLGVGFKLFER